MIKESGNAQILEEEIEEAVHFQNRVKSPEVDNI